MGGGFRSKYAGLATTTRRLSASRIETRLESGRSPIRIAQSMPSLTRSTRRSVRSRLHETSGFISRKSRISGATWIRPKPAGAEMRRCPLAFTPPRLTDASVKDLKGLKGLRELNTAYSKISEAGVKELMAALPKTRVGHAYRATLKPDPRRPGK